MDTNFSGIQSGFILSSAESLRSSQPEVHFAELPSAIFHGTICKGLLALYQVSSYYSHLYTVKISAVVNCRLQLQRVKKPNSYWTYSEKDNEHRNIQSKLVKSEVVGHSAIYILRCVSCDGHSRFYYFPF